MPPRVQKSFQRCALFSGLFCFIVFPLTVALVPQAKFDIDFEISTQGNYRDHIVQSIPRLHEIVTPHVVSNEISSVEDTFPNMKSAASSDAEINKATKLAHQYLELAQTPNISIGDLHPETDQENNLFGTSATRPFSRELGSCETGTCDIGSVCQCFTIQSKSLSASNSAETGVDFLTVNLDSSPITLTAEITFYFGDPSSCCGGCSRQAYIYIQDDITAASCISSVDWYDTLTMSHTITVSEPGCYSVLLAQV